MGLGTLYIHSMSIKELNYDFFIDKFYQISLQQHVWCGLVKYGWFRNEIIFLIRSDKYNDHIQFDSKYDNGTANLYTLLEIHV